MNAIDHIRKLKEFFEKYLYAELAEKVRIGSPCITIDFLKLAKFDPILADELIEKPEEIIKAAEISIEQFDFPNKISNFKVRIKNLTPSQEIDIRDIRSKHIGKLLMVSGIVRQKSDVRPQVTSAKFECPSCGNIQNILQLDSKFREPTSCGCGRKGKFSLLSKELIDAQGLVLEEAMDHLDGSAQPKRINVLLKQDLVSPLSDKKTNPGTRIYLVGFVKEVPILARDGGKLTRYDLIFEANFLDMIDEDYTDIKIGEEEKEKIKDLAAKKDCFKILISSLAPGIYGHDEIKKSLLLQLLGGVKKNKNDGVSNRGDIHILLVGDPGAGKSQLLKRASKVAPKSRFISGKGVSGAGLTATVVKDEFLKGWALEAGALVLANKGFAMIDELDKMSHDDRSAMHEALEGQTVTISKANVQATLQCETTVLAAANPKYGRFDPYEIIPKQIDLPPTLLNRFVLIFPVRDIPSIERDERLARFILKMHQTSSTETVELDTEFLRKYIAYARQSCEPKLTTDALDIIREYYVKMRNSGSPDEAGTKAIPISARQLEGLVRLSEASAKSRLAEKVSANDAKLAVEITHYCLSQIGIDPDTGQIDIDRIGGNVTSSERSKIHIIKDILMILENEIGKVMPTEEIITMAESKGMSKDQAEEVLEKLRRNGEIYEPKRGMISRI